MINFFASSNPFRIKGRNQAFDTLKGILILCVFLGNFMHTIPPSNQLLAYLYLFHIPLFVFISGYFSRRFDLKSIALLTIIYLLYGLVFNPENPDCTIGGLLHNPPSYMWYIESLIFWRLMQPLTSLLLRRAKLPVLCSFFALGLGVGYLPYDISAFNISRTLSYWPLFVLGSAVSDTELRTAVNYFSRFKLIFYNLLIILFSISFTFITPTWYLDLYNKYNYAGTFWGDFGIIIRSAQFISAAIIGITLTRITLSHPSAFLSLIGRHTLLIYIFMAYTLSSYSHLWRELWLPLWLNLGLGILTIILCSWFLARLSETCHSLRPFRHG